MQTTAARSSSAADPLQPSLVLPPAAAVFLRRAQRLRQLAPAHPAAAWLEWLARLGVAQHEVLTPILAAAPDDPAAAPPPSVSWLPAFRQIAAQMAPTLVERSEHMLALRAASAFALARGEAVASLRDELDLIVAAALQVAWTGFAQRGAFAMQTGRAAHCPCCGCAAVGSIVLAGEGRAGLRYLECTLCATRWHAVRANCCFCDQGAPVDYYSLADHHPAVQAEACSACGAYLKTMFQVRDAGVDPLADDLASLALDALVCEQGFVRGAPNLFLCDSEPA